jgi:hypothetical protein
MKHKTRKALAMVPVIGVLAFGPSFTYAAKDSTLPEGTRYERMEAAAWRMEKGVSSTLPKLERQRMNRMLDDHGKHQSWFQNNPSAQSWAQSVFAAIGDNNYEAFRSLTMNTTLGDATTESKFRMLSDTMKKMKSRDREATKTSLRSLRDQGYRFKQLFHDALEMKFGSA